MTFPVNLTLTCYYFQNLLLSRDVNSSRRCYVNYEIDSVTQCLTLTCYYFKALLLSHDVYSPRQCYVNNEIDSVTPCLT
jgi:hypothetical protein